jgi:hypothetical protein
MSRRNVLPSKWTWSTPAYASLTASGSVDAYAVTAMTRPPEVTTWFPSDDVPAWNTVTPDGTAPISMALPFGYEPGYPCDAKITETAEPGRVSILTESSRRSAHACAE